MHRRLAGLAALLLALFGSAPAAAEDDRAEKFVYDVTWGEARVASLEIQVGCTRKAYRPAMMQAKSRGVAEQIHAFTVRLDSFLDDDGRTLEGRTFIEEEGVPRSFKSRFSTDETVRVTKRYREETSKQTVRLPGPGHDLLSWLLALRAENLSVGETFDFHVWDGWKLFRMDAAVDRVESVWTPVGVFDAYRVSLTRTRLHHEGEEAHRPKAEPEKIGRVWMTKDDRQVPVAMTYDAPVGAAKIVLKRKRSKACR